MRLTAVRNLDSIWKEHTYACLLPKEGREAELKDSDQVVSVAMTALVHVPAQAKRLPWPLLLCSAATVGQGFCQGGCEDWASLDPSLTSEQGESSYDRWSWEWPTGSGLELCCAGTAPVCGSDHTWNPRWLLLLQLFFLLGPRCQC